MRARNTHAIIAALLAASITAQAQNGIWLPLGSGVNGEVSALAVSGSTLYVGGNFTNAGGVAANYIAQWDGTNWLPLGSGLSANPNEEFPVLSALAVSGSTLYAGGDFGWTNGPIRVGKWNGNSWLTAGSGVLGDDETVNALAVSDGKLYAAGECFFSAGANQTINDLALLEGSNWSPLGLGVGPGKAPGVNALAISGSKLYVGGGFTTAGGKTIKYIAQWNGSVWSSLGSGISAVSGGTIPLVYSLAVSGSMLYVGGEFTTAGTNTANNIAQWNGTNWSPLGLGLNGGVTALAVSGSTLFVGGNFTMAGANAANNIAQWNGTNWSPLGSGLNGSVTALAVSGSTLFVGGNFTNAGGIAANFVAQWTFPSEPSLSITTTNGKFGFTNQQFQFTLTGPVNSNVVVQASTDLKTWIPLATNVLVSGSVTFTDVLTTNYPERFYRAQQSQ